MSLKESTSDMYTFKKIIGGPDGGQKSRAGAAFLPRRSRYRGISKPLTTII
jgi:hypothetical protein